MSRWPFEPLTWAGLIVAAAAYARRASRVGRWPPARTASFYSGLAVTAFALVSPLATLAHDRFSAHMVQHLLLTVVAAPLVLLGAPGVLLVRTASPSGRRRYASFAHTRTARAVSHPVFAWVFFAVVMWGTHFSGLYEAALQNAGVHALEHALYLSAGFLFWWPVVGVDPGAGALAFPLRIAYLVLIMPVQAFLGLAIYSAGEILYEPYEGALGALADQQTAAVIMWVGGDLLILMAVVCVLFAWMRNEDRVAARVDHRLGVHR